MLFVRLNNTHVSIQCETRADYSPIAAEPGGR